VAPADCGRIAVPPHIVAYTSTVRVNVLCPSYFDTCAKRARSGNCSNAGVGRRSSPLPSNLCLRRGIRVRGFSRR
jgi:hypothetical protein